ncbi:MAG: hypothetical protein WAZ12_05355 [Candidatus Absconditicoccaceae bacterium]
MDKKEYILRMLDILQNTWPLARGLRLLVESNNVNDDIIDILINTFQETIKNIQDNIVKDKLKNASSFLQELKQREIEEKANDESDIAKLEELLANI